MSDVAVILEDADGNRVGGDELPLDALRRPDGAPSMFDGVSEFEYEVFATDQAAELLAELHLLAATHRENDFAAVVEMAERLAAADGLRLVVTPFETHEALALRAEEQ